MGKTAQYRHREAPYAVTADTMRNEWESQWLGLDKAD